MRKRSIFYWNLPHVMFSLFLYCPIHAHGANILKNRVLSISKGSCIISASSSYSERWEAENLIDENYRRGWRSKRNSPFPHIFIFELAIKANIDLLKFKNSLRKSKSLESSAKEVRVEFSTTSPHSGYIDVGTFNLEKGAMLQEFSIDNAKARWIRLSINSNYGHPQLTELLEFEAHGAFEFKILQIISNFIWILGASIILAAFGYHEFQAYTQGTKRIEAFKRNSFMKPLLLGLILAGLGISASIPRLWITATAGGAAALLTIWFFKAFKKQTIASRD